MYRPLPYFLTIKKSPIEGLGLYATKDIKANTFIGLTHIYHKDFENNYIRTPLGGFYNHSNKPNIARMISNNLPKLRPGDTFESASEISKIPEVEMDRSTDTPKGDAKYMYLVTIRNIKEGEELAANYNLYTYPSSGVGFQTL